MMLMPQITMYALIIWMLFAIQLLGVGNLFLSESETSPIFMPEFIFVLERCLQELLFVCFADQCVADFLDSRIKGSL